ncbi:MAG: HlyD family secretion protein [Chitinophagales bacterium]
MRFILFSLAVTLVACQHQQSDTDAYGNFEAEERLVSAEGTGKIIELTVEEGQRVQAGQVVGRIDSTQIVLKIAQLEASILAILAKKPAIGAQLAVFDDQAAVITANINNLERERKRIENLVKKDAATPQQFDQLNDQLIQLKRQLEVVQAQKSAAFASLNVQQTGITAEVAPLQHQIAQLRDQLQKCRITVPATGVVLTKFAEPGEVTSVGKPLFKTADLDNMILRAYISGGQLSSVQLGQEVSVLVDGPDGQRLSRKGKISTIADKAEFTPKVIQTKEERVNLVYAIQIAVPNDGIFKIGMPAEVQF